MLTAETAATTGLAAVAESESTKATGSVAVMPSRGAIVRDLVRDAFPQIVREVCGKTASRTHSDSPPTPHQKRENPHVCGGFLALAC
jgi:hypothetical protein